MGTNSEKVPSKGAGGASRQGPITVDGNRWGKVRETQRAPLRLGGLTNDGGAVREEGGGVLDAVTPAASFAPRWFWMLKGVFVGHGSVRIARGDEVVVVV